MRQPAILPQVRTTSTNPADEAARRWRANLPGRLRRRSTMRGSALLLVAFAGYIACMAGAALLPTFFWRTVSLGLAPMMIGALFVIGHDAAHNSLTPYTW